MSASRTDDGSCQIEPSRVYPFPAVAQEGGATGEMVRHATPATVADAISDRLVAVLREQLNDMRGERDRWRDQAERLTRLLSDRQDDQRQGRPAPQGARGEQLMLSLERGEEAVGRLWPSSLPAVEQAEAAEALVRRPW
jgi:hypothetical protein